jgi:hypothetical protein
LRAGKGSEEQDSQQGQQRKFLHLIFSFSVLLINFVEEAVLV